MTRPLLAGLSGLLLTVAGCTVDPSLAEYRGADDPQVSAAVDRDALPGAFTICHGYGCQWRSPAGLTPAEWHVLANSFATAAPTPADERRRVAEAVAFIERAVGTRVGTINDRPRTPFSFMDRSQLDCIDEAINTSTTLHLLKTAGYLSWHTPGEPAQRGRAFFLNVHFTAVLIESGSADRYAVDSWFFEPGVVPAVLPLAVWRDGWQPGNRVVAAAR